MKRSVVLCLVLIMLSLLFVSMLVYAQDQAVDNSGNAGPDTLTQTAAQAGNNLKNLTGNLTGSLNDRTEDLLERSIVLPGWLKMLSSVLFGLEEGVSIQRVIVIFGVFIMLFIFILSILDTFGVFPTKFVQVLISFGVAGLISMSGAVKFMADLLIDVIDSIKFVSEMSSAILFFSIIILFVMVIGVRILLKAIKKHRTLAKAEESGREIGETVNISKNINDVVEKVGE